MLLEALKILSMYLIGVLGAIGLTYLAVMLIILICGFIFKQNKNRSRE